MMGVFELLGSRHTLTSPFGFLGNITEETHGVGDDFLFYQEVQLLVDGFLLLDVYLPSGMCCWLDCRVQSDVVLSLQATKSVKGVWV